MSDIEVIDLTPNEPPRNRPDRPPSRFSSRHRALAALIVAVLAVGGLRVHAVRAPATDTAATGTTDPDAPAPAVPPAPAVVPAVEQPPVRFATGPLLTGTGARLVLVGATLTTYDLSTGRSTRPLGTDEDGSVLAAVALADGEVAVEPIGFDSGKAYGVTGRGRTSLGVATSVIAGAQVDTAWLTYSPDTGAPARVRLVGLSGGVLAGPFAIPTTWRLERAVTGGLLMSVGAPGGPHELHLWTPGSSSPGPLVADHVVRETSGAGQLLTVDTAGAVTLNGAPSTLPGDAEGYAFAPGGATLAVLGKQTVRLEPTSPGRVARVVPLPPGPAGVALSYAPSGWLFVSRGTRLLALAPGAAAFRQVPAVFTDPTVQVLAAAAIAKAPNPRVGR